MRALQALDVILSESNNERGIRVGRSFFCRPRNPFDLEDGYEAWTGLFQAAILGEVPFLNVDIAHKSFPRESPLLDYLANNNISLEEPLESYEYRNVERYLKNIDIVYQPPASFGSFDKRYKVMGLGDSASKLTFKNDEGAQMTIAAYFQSRGYILKYPQLNCVKVGSTVRSIYLPMELCKIAEGQALNVSTHIIVSSTCIYLLKSCLAERRIKTSAEDDTFCRNFNQSPQGKNHGYVDVFQS